MRIVGVDPGTKTFDIVALEEGVIVAEKSLDTITIAKDPQKLMEAIDSLNPDYVVAPSGYGIPLTFGDNVRNSRRLAVEVLLLSSEEDIKIGVEAGEIGIWVYDAIAKTISHLVNGYRERAVFLPGVIHLPTVPWYRKINKVDMGTVDKLASTFLAVFEISERFNVDYSDVNLIVVELGYGYIATIAVEKGVIVDGIGGTYASIGTLTAGALDLEVVVGAKSWSRWDVFHGGIFYKSSTFDLSTVIKGFEKSEEPYTSMFRVFIESIVKDVNRVRASTPRSDIVVLTGRHSRYEVVAKHIREYLKDLDVITLRGLKGVSKAKEAAQGYTAIGEGIVGGVFKELAEHMKVKDACGTAVDYIIHPRAKNFVERVRGAYIESIYKPKLCEEGSL
ncbi:MAG: DUF1464 family protein [Desulfurococcaceae archaeon]|nr:DUF1464 family protein [Sulfolobales archaeon]MDW8170151.1 DUF1464 family protein [Desulfurococcaceae archaeon]